MSAVVMDQINTIEALNRALHEAMAADPSVIVLGEEVGDKEGGGIQGVTKGLSTAFGTGRVKSTPISEQAIIGAAIGASLVGFKPVAEIMLMNFTTVAMDMIINHAAKLRFMSGGQTNVPITIRMMTGAGRQTGGQHADYFEAWFAHTPGITVVAPSNPADAYGLLLACIDDEDPCIFVENFTVYRVPGPLPEPGVRIPLRKANIIRKGDAATVISYSRIANDALAVVDKLAGEGIAVEMIDLRTVAPWDKEAVLESVRRTGRALVVHEAVRDFGPGAEIAAVISELAFESLKAPVGRIGGAFSPVPFSQPLEAAFLPGQLEIEAELRRILAYDNSARAV